MGIKGGEDKREPFWYLAQGSWGSFSEEGAPELSPEESEGAGDRMSKDKKDDTEKSIPISIEACCNISHNTTIPLVLSSPILPISLFPLQQESLKSHHCIRLPP